MTKIYNYKQIKNKEYKFEIICDHRGKHLLMSISILRKQKTMFEKERNRLTILKEMANSKTYSINEKVRLKLEPIGFGTKWQGHYELCR